MSSASLLALLCGTILLTVGVLGIGYLLLTSRKSKKKTTTITTQSTQTGFRSWIVSIIIVIVLANWSLVFALFFLAVVWVMRLNPKLDSKEIAFPSEKDKKRAKGTYTWLLFSPFLNVVVLLIAVIGNYSISNSTDEWVLIALLPLVFHLPVLVRLDSNNPFVFRHTQQAIFLLALRASMTSLALNIGRYPEDGIWLFLLGNGFLWLFGSFWGRGQAHQGTGWWIKQKGEKILSKEIVPAEEPLITGEELDTMLKSLNAKGNTTRQQALSAFHQGTREDRKKAVLILNKLGEVEKF